MVFSQAFYYWFASAIAVAIANLASYSLGRYKRIRKWMGWPTTLTIVVLIIVAVISVAQGLMHSYAKLPVAIAVGVVVAIILLIFSAVTFALGVNSAWKSRSHSGWGQ